MHHRPNEKKTVIPAPRIRGGKLRRESTAYRRGTKRAINYVHLLICSLVVGAQCLRPQSLVSITIEITILFPHQPK